MLATEGSTGPGRLPAALLAYAAALAVFLLVPPFFKGSVGPVAAFTVQEALDLLTPLVVLPLAWYVLDCTGGLGRRGLIAFLVAAALWTEGQGIHLAANAIGDAFGSHAAAEAFYATVPGELDLWFDEGLSHWMWHLAWAAISILMLALATTGEGRTARAGRMAHGVAGVAGLLYGATFFAATTEGETTLIGIPLSVLLVVWAAVARRRGRSRSPVVTFFIVGPATTLLAYLTWAAVNDWTLPEICTATAIC
jgi:hypothetical protein